MVVSIFPFMVMVFSFFMFMFFSFFVFMLLTPLLRPDIERLPRSPRPVLRLAAPIDPEIGMLCVRVCVCVCVV